MNKANNSSAMKDENRRHILRLIREKGASRAELSRMTGLTRAAVSIIVDGLIEDGLITVGETVKASAGRHPTMLNINSDAVYAIGVDISREGCFLGVCDFLLQIIEKDFIPFESTAEKTVEALIKKLSVFIKKYPQIKGIGISSPGPVDVKNGIILNPPELETFHNFNIVEALKNSFSVPVILEKDTNALALAEKNARNIDNFLFVLADHGLGGGFIKEGKLFKGFNGFGCEIGHISLDYNGPLCACGNRGCAGLYTSVPNTVKKGGTKDYKQLCFLAKNNDEKAIKAVKYQGEMLANALTTAINLFEPECIILGGELRQADFVLCPAIEKKLAEKTMTGAVHKVKIDSSALTEAPRTVAAASLVTEKFF